MLTTVEVSAAATFEHIIRHQGPAELLPWLLQLAKPEIVPVRAKVKSLHKELSEFRQRSTGHWAQLMEPRQEVMLFLAGLATYSRKEALARSFTMPGQFTLDQQQHLHREWLLLVLEHARPDWLADWFERRTRANEWQAPDYPLLRELENRALLPHHPWLFARSLAHQLHSRGWQVQAPQSQTAPDPTQLVLQQLQAAPLLLTRDLPLLFDFDTPVDSAAIYQPSPAENVTWLGLISQLAALGRLDRSDLLMRCLLALRRDFRRPLLSWFKSLFLALQPSPAECLARQQELVELLAHPLPLVVNFALEQLKPVWTEADFQADALLLYADGLMTRPDLKTGVKTLLGGLGKLLKAKPAQAPVLARLYAAALTQADAPVQGRAAKGLAALLQAQPPLLTAQEVSQTTDTLGLYADLLPPAARQLLAPWLPAASPATPELLESYAPELDFTPDLSSATAIALVGDWHELLFLTGQVLRHNDPTALERWLDGLLRLRSQFPLDYATALQPYLQQANPMEQAALQQKPSFSPGHLGLVEALTLSWARGFTERLVPLVSLRPTYSVSDPLVAVEQQRLAFVERLLAGERLLPLLSTPTHAPHWLAPTALVQRLLAYDAAQQEPDAADLAVALARTAITSTADTDTALTLLHQLRHQGLRELLRWLLSPAFTPLPTTVTGRKSLRQQFTERLGRWLSLPAPPVPDSLAEALPWLWAVAARSRQPSATFPELAGLTINGCPGLVQPWQPRWELQPQSKTYVERWKPGQPTVTERWMELKILSADTVGVAPSRLLLYSLHGVIKPGSVNHPWQQLAPLAADYPFLLSLLPHCPAPLYWHSLRLAASRDQADTSGREVLSQALRSLIGAGASFDEPATLLLAIGLTYRDAGGRALALEVLLAAVEHRRLLPAALGQTLSRLLAAEFVPVQRLADGLALARAISPATDDALRQLLEALLPGLPTEPLRNTRKLLDAYADLLIRRPQPLPPLVQTRLHEWCAVPSLTKMAKALLA